MRFIRLRRKDLRPRRNLPSDLRIPRIPSDQRILVEPHIDPSRTQRRANKGSVSFTLSIAGLLCSNNERNRHGRIAR